MGSVRLALVPPILGVTCFIAACLICYGVAVSKGHVALEFPYISNTGSQLPESCLFSILFNVGSASGYLIFLTRYLLLKLYFGTDDIRIVRANKAGLGLGFIAVSGIFVVGNFQASDPNPEIHMVHWVCAGVGMASAVLYVWVQSFLSRLTTTERHELQLLRPHERWIVGLRFTLAIFCILSFIGFAVCLVIADEQFKGTNKDLWTAADGGYTPHLVSTACEWILFLSIMLSYLSFVMEFRFVVFRAPPVFLAFDRSRVAPIVA